MIGGRNRTPPRLHMTREERRALDARIDAMLARRPTLEAAIRRGMEIRRG